MQIFHETNKQTQLLIHCHTSPRMETFPSSFKLIYLYFVLHCKLYCNTTSNYYWDQQKNRGGTHMMFSSPIIYIFDCNINLQSHSLCIINEASGGMDL